MRTPATVGRPGRRGPRGVGRSRLGRSTLAVSVLGGRGLVALGRAGVHGLVVPGIVDLGGGGACGVAGLALAGPPLTGLALTDSVAARVRIASGRAVAGAGGVVGGVVGLGFAHVTEAGL
ncbi:hypothetical protein, partial [Microbispora hainanensis]